MPRAIDSLNNYSPYLNDAPSGSKPQHDIGDRILTGAVALSTAVIVVGFVFAVARFFG
jgi:hypothetical protein